MDIKPTAIDTQTSMMLGQHNSKSKEDLKQVAEQFEAIFINQILKQSRETKLADDLFGSSATSTYEQILDSQTSEKIASHVNLGIAEALVRQFSRDGE